MIDSLKKKVQPRILVIGGPTATGKTAYAVEIAEAIGGEIINADSMQVYRGLDAGTAKPTAEELKRVPFHLVDVADPQTPFNAGAFVELADRAIKDIVGRNRPVIVCGGTGMYIRSLIHGLIEVPPPDLKLREKLYRLESENGPGALHARLAEVDPQKAAELSAADLLRIVRALEVFELTGVPLSELHRRHREMPPRYDSLLLCIDRERESLYERIERRVERMIEDGLVAEVRSLLDSGVPETANSMQGLGYRQLTRYLNDEISLEQAVELIKRDTRRFAKRQWTWFRNQPDVLWFRVPEQAHKLHQAANDFLNSANDSDKT